MAQYKFPTTVGEVEFKELGSDEVSFNLQFYNNKDANLEHIETTPHKVNGLFIFMIRKKDAFYWGIVLPGFVFFLLFLARLLSQHTNIFLSDGFTSQTSLLYAHIIFFILTYLFLSIAFLTSLFFLFRHFQLRNKKITWKKEIPSLNGLHQISSWLINFSFFILSLAVLFLIFIQPSTIANLNSLSFRVLVPILLWCIYGISFISSVIAASFLILDSTNLICSFSISCMIFKKPLLPFTAN